MAQPDIDDEPTGHSAPVSPWFPVALAIAAIIAYLIGGLMAIPANPEIQFWSQVVDHRDKEIGKERADHPDQGFIFFTGGSSCAFSIDPLVVEARCARPAFNLGLPVSAGREFLLHQAMERTSSGDLLVVCLEPDLLTYDTDLSGATQFGFAMATTAGDVPSAAGGDTFKTYTKVPDYLNLSRPGLRFTTTLMGKMLMGKGYRYTMEDLKSRGRLETPISAELTPVPPPTATRLSDGGRQFLGSVKSAAADKGVEVVYSLPWQYTQNQDVEEARANRRELLADIRSIMPAIDDAYAGVVTNGDYFSDTGLHLTAQGSELRSDSLARSLAQWMADE